MKPSPIEQRIAEIKAAIPGLTEEQQEVIRKAFERDRYESNLIGAINRSKVQELKAA